MVFRLFFSIFQATAFFTVLRLSLTVNTSFPAFIMYEIIIDFNLSK